MPNTTPVYINPESGTEILSSQLISQSSSGTDVLDSETLKNMSNDIVSTKSNYNDSLEFKDPLIAANGIVDKLIENNGFIKARQIAVQTYTQEWFTAELDILFSLMLAQTLSKQFGKDGYRCHTWEKIIGKVGQ